MNEILEYLVKHCSFLWASGRYRISDSAVSTSFGGDSYLIACSDALRLRFVRDRGQLFLDLQPPWADKQDEWYSVDLVYWLVMGERRPSAELDDEYGGFIRDRLQDIERLFSDEEKFKETKSRLDFLMKQRAKQMFG